VMVHVHVGKDASDRQRVGHISFAAATQLAVVGLFGIKIGTADQIDLVGAEVGRKSFGEVVYARQGRTPN